MRSQRTCAPGSCTLSKRLKGSKAPLASVASHSLNPVKAFTIRAGRFYRINGFKANYAEAGTNAPYWVSGPRRDGRDRLYSPSGLPVEIDEDVREEYWREIRNKPEWGSRATS
jgi:hypothetical protein